MLQWNLNIVNHVDFFQGGLCMNHSELDLTSLLSLSFSTSINELHSRLSELGFGDIRPVHGFMFKCMTPNGATGIELAEHLGITKQAVS